MKRIVYVVALVLGLIAGGVVHLATGTGSSAESQADPAPLTTPLDESTERPDPASDGIREVTLTAEDRRHRIFRNVEIGVVALNGQFPAPTIRAIENESVRIELVNDASRPMTLHFHGMHGIDYDGVHEIVPPGESYTYWLNGTPPGLYMYHSHVLPLAETENRVAVGAFIVDPAEPRSPAKEIVMHGKADDTDDVFEEAEFYSYNGIANRYLDDPITLDVNQTLRVYFVNVNVEQVTFFHVHGTVYQTQAMGRGEPVTNDNTPIGYGERDVIEVSWANPGLWMFHDHIAEHMERGMMGWVKVSR